MIKPQFPPDLVDTLTDVQKRLNVLERAARLTSVGVYDSSGNLRVTLTANPNGYIGLYNSSGTLVAQIDATDGSITALGGITTGDKKFEFTKTSSTRLDITTH